MRFESDATVLSSDPVDRPPRPSIGVVFVHGIGSQPQSATLRGFAQPLIDWLALWHESRDIDGCTLQSAELSYGGTLKGPARLRLDIPAVSNERGTWPARSWVMAEAWWATRLQAPSFGHMLWWSLRNVWLADAKLIEQTIYRWRLVLARVLGRPIGGRRPAYSEPGLFGAFIELVSTGLLIGGYTLGGLVGYAVLVPLFAVAQIPIQRFQQFVMVNLIRPLLVDAIGDFTTYLEDDIQALNIREQVASTIDWLVDEEQCEQVVVLAYSQGTVVAFDALASRSPTHLDKVRKLITVGAALNKAFELAHQRRLAGTLPEHIYWLDTWAYYDPVPGGQLVREGTAAPLVAPTASLAKRMHWNESTVHWDAPPGPPSGPQPREVTNGMNVLTDHTGYWRNAEQFIARVAQEVDDPDGYYQASRFVFPDEKERVRRRRLRVTTLVGWRLAAMYLFAVAVGGRVTHAGWALLTQDGRQVRDWVTSLPGAQLLGIPGEIFSAIGTLAHLLAEPFRATPAIADPLDRLASAVGADRWEPLAMAALGVVFFAGLFAIVYVLLAWFVFSPWNSRELRASVRPVLLTDRPLILARSVAMLLPLFLLAIVVARPL
jgi:hypothetical protein